MLWNGELKKNESEGGGAKLADRVEENDGEQRRWEKE